MPRGESLSVGAEVREEEMKREEDRLIEELEADLKKEKVVLGELKGVEANLESQDEVFRTHWSSVKSNFKCPLCQNIMTSPVVIGGTYLRDCRHAACGQCLVNRIQRTTCTQAGLTFARCWESDCQRHIMDKPLTDYTLLSALKVVNEEGADPFVYDWASLGLF